MGDMIRSPRDPSHVFDIRRADATATLLAPDTVDNVVVITEDGSDILRPIDVNADALRRRPHLVSTTRQIIHAANVRWAMDELGTQGNVDG